MLAQRIASLLIEDEGGFKFTSVVNDTMDVDILDAPQGWDFQNVNATIKWTLDMDARSWGIKELNPSIISLKIDCVFEVSENGEERLIEFAYPANTIGKVDRVADHDDIKAYALELTGPVLVDVDARFNARGSGISINHIEIDYRNRQVVIEFG